MSPTSPYLPFFIVSNMYELESEHDDVLHGNATRRTNGRSSTTRFLVIRAIVVKCKKEDCAMK